MSAALTELSLTFSSTTSTSSLEESFCTKVVFVSRIQQVSYMEGMYLGPSAKLLVDVVKDFS
jgi:hypothetical protein